VSLAVCVACVSTTVCCGGNKQINKTTSQEEKRDLINRKYDLFLVGDNKNPKLNNIVAHKNVNSSRAKGATANTQNKIKTNNSGCDTQNAMVTWLLASLK
jgi:hypothetical protein